MDAIEFGRINNNIILGKMYVWWVFFCVAKIDCDFLIIIRRQTKTYGDLSRRSGNYMINAPLSSFRSIAVCALAAAFVRAQSKPHVR